MTGVNDSVMSVTAPATFGEKSMAVLRKEPTPGDCRIGAAAASPE